ncbi:MAG: PAS domain S-box protein [Bacteroidota bacterium]
MSLSPGKPDTDTHFSGGGALGEIIRSTDWSATPLGRPETWSDELRQAINIVIQTVGQSGNNSNAAETQHDLKGSLAEANEELAAANEELAAANEEYITINEELGRTKDDLERSEKLFKSIALNIPNSLIIMIDKNHRFITIEGDIMEKMGYKGMDYAGKHPTEVAPPERYEATKHLYERVLAGERFSEERISAAGETFMVHMVPLKNEAGDVDAGLMIALDISEIKKGEEKSARLAAIIDSSDDGIISKTLESVITSWNDSAERMFGYNSEEMIGESIYKLIPEDRKEEEPRILARLHKGERVEHFETKRLTKDGRLLDVSLTVSPVKDKGGKIIGLSKIARDITAQKMEEQRKNDFVAMVSHELKTPLTTINSYVQILLNQAKKEGESAAFRINALTRTEVQVKKMTAMIHDFLSLARLEEGKIPVNKSIFELHPLTEEIADDVQFATAKHNIQLVDCVDIKVNADRDKIGQVLTNLLSNAVKYSPNGGDISIGCEKLGNQVKIFVTDQGVGISAADKERLFERFYRVKSEKLKTVSGFGIGLYLVAEVLRIHGSRIEVQSEPGKGSTFFFMLDIV